jgi:hypothetical protein
MARVGVLAFAILVTACNPHGPEHLGHVPIGTWGGENAGLLVSEAGAHVHIGCTLGDLSGPIPVDSRGRFDVAGTYDVDVFPVARGIIHPARFTGWTDGHALTLSVRLTDTGQTLGPVAVILGQTPRMQVCPICRSIPK